MPASLTARKALRGDTGEKKTFVGAGRVTNGVKYYMQQVLKFVHPHKFLDGQSHS
jgi:hypothetical protein